jgi:uncharacterized protein (DUF305 family)
MALTRGSGKTSTVGTGEVPADDADVSSEDDESLADDESLEDDEPAEDVGFEDVGFEDVSSDGVAFEDVASDGDEPPVEPRAGRGRRFAAIAAIVLLLLGIGYAAGRLTPLFTAPGDDSAEAGFARDMTVHHGQAVHMAMVEYDRGQDATLRRMAYDIATSQQYQIGVMEGWLREWRLPLTTDRPPMAWVPNGANMLQPDGRMPGIASNDELKRLEDASGRDADILFCQLMLRHHLGGIHMVDAVLQASDNDRVRDLAQQMRIAQQGEIDAMSEMLRAWGAQPL